MILTSCPAEIQSLLCIGVCVCVCVRVLEIEKEGVYFYKDMHLSVFM